MSSTTLTDSGISPVAINKSVTSKKFSLAKHDAVGFFFAFLVTVPMWLAVAFPAFGVSLLVNLGTVLGTVVMVIGYLGYAALVLLLTAVCVKAAGAK